MTPLTLSLALSFNSRVIAGINAVEQHWTDEFAVTPGDGYRDRLHITLQSLDLGRWDIEGDAYLCDFLNILPGDIIDAEAK